MSLLDMSSGSGQNLSQFLNDPSNALGIGLLAAGGPTTDPNASGFGARIAGAVKSSQAAQLQAAALFKARQEAAMMSLGTQWLANRMGSPGAATAANVPGGPPSAGAVPSPVPGLLALGAGPGGSATPPGGPGAATAAAGSLPPVGPGSGPPIGLLAPGAGAAPPDPGAPTPQQQSPGAAVASAGISPAPTVPPTGPTPASAPGLFGMSGSPSDMANVAAAFDLAQGKGLSGVMPYFMPKMTDVGGGNFQDMNPITNPGFHGGQQTVVTNSPRTGVATGIRMGPNGPEEFVLPGADAAGKIVNDTVNQSRAANTQSKQGIQVGGAMYYPSEQDTMNAARQKLGLGGAPAPAPPAAGPTPPPLLRVPSSAGIPSMVDGTGQPVGPGVPVIGRYATLPNGQVDATRAQAAIDTIPAGPVRDQAMRALSQQIAAQKPLIALAPTPGASASSGNPALDALTARQAALSAQADGSAGPSAAVRQEMEANAKAIGALQTAQATGSVNAQQEAAAKSWANVSTNAQNAPRIIALAQQLQQISAGKNPATAAFLDTDMGRKASIDAAEYNKTAATLKSLIAPGGQGTDASRATIADTVPPFGYRDAANQAGLNQIIQLARGDALRGQVLGPKFTSGAPTSAADYVNTEQQFNQQITPAAVPIIAQINAMPRGPQKKAALQAFAAANPAAANWAAENGALR